VRRLGRALLLFLLSLVLFLLVPPALLSLEPVEALLHALESYNAAMHAEVLALLGMSARSSGNLLYLSSGAMVEYTPFCFGFLTIAGLSMLMLLLPSPGLVERLLWLFKASVLLLLANQLRILLELFIALQLPIALPVLDRALYPLLPGLALVVWRGLLRRVSAASPRGGSAAG